MLSINLVISLLFTTLLCGLLFFYIRQRNDSIENRMSTLFNLIESEANKQHAYRVAQTSIHLNPQPSPNNSNEQLQGLKPHLGGNVESTGQGGLFSLNEADFEDDNITDLDEDLETIHNTFILEKEGDSKELQDTKTSPVDSEMFSHLISNQRASSQKMKEVVVYDIQPTSADGNEVCLNSTDEPTQCMKLNHFNGMDDDNDELEYEADVESGDFNTANTFVMNFNSATRMDKWNPRMNAMMELQLLSNIDSQNKPNPKVEELDDSPDNTPVLMDKYGDSINVEFYRNNADVDENDVKPIEIDLCCDELQDNSSEPQTIQLKSLPPSSGHNVSSEDVFDDELHEAIYVKHDLSEDINKIPISDDEADKEPNDVNVVDEDLAVHKEEIPDFEAPPTPAELEHEGDSVSMTGSNSMIGSVVGVKSNPYSKLTVLALRQLAIERKLVESSSAAGKLKKKQLIELLSKTI